MPALTLLALQDTFAVSKLPADSPMPAWATSGSLVSITRTRDELSIVCKEENVPNGVTCSERAWRCLRVAGQMDFSLVGILASLVTPLAIAGIPVLVLSTFDTDYLLIQAEQFEAAVKALSDEGHHVDCTTRV